ncbi:endonuclease/exonuclease/phosphatase family protein [Allokutzneria sp. A3M-2-11 16]|uniref:endonuclease/exonuclease/phosphatase family protein n=1 Tax=Allokutzneria sp. A3M-2-11 16 TaxID=2962043 RepID=UPI0020B7E160|nr:endonuclease/exonuclease/phosphatase family protein [Allokutzneria sp. A3M-2-11 16]MCP3799943.1 endonuclease/exonuclease/phosphatase family protein [Allokutzneria sp. A3M-2-11 16]
MHPQTTYPAYQVERPVEPMRRARGGTAVGFLLWLVAVPYFVLCLARLLGLDGSHWILVAVVSLTPYALPLGAVLTAILLFTRRWIVGLVSLLLTVLLVTVVAPRTAAAARPNGSGPLLRVLSVNISMDHGDAATVVRLVRDRAVDLLSIQELTPGAERALDAAGLAEVLPHRVFKPRPGAVGGGLASRFPLRETVVTRPTTAEHPAAVIDLPAGPDVEFVSVHPWYPVGPRGTEPWLRDMAGLPSPDGLRVPRILAGDFNASLDHSVFRGLLNQGYLDAAEQAGAGLTPTWPADKRFVPAFVALDHVLVDNKNFVVESFGTAAVPGTDHRAVIAEVKLVRG